MHQNNTGIVQLKAMMDELCKLICKISTVNPLQIHPVHHVRLLLSYIHDAEYLALPNIFGFLSII